MMKYQGIRSNVALLNRPIVKCSHPSMCPSGILFCSAHVKLAVFRIHTSVHLSLNSPSCTLGVAGGGGGVSPSQRAERGGGSVWVRMQIHVASIIQQAGKCDRPRHVRANVPPGARTVTWRRMISFTGFTVWKKIRKKRKKRPQEMRNAKWGESYGELVDVGRFWR